MTDAPHVGDIYRLIPLIAAQIGAIRKTRRNKDQNYNFRGIDDFLNALHSALCEHGVFVIPEVIGREETTIATRSGSAWLHTVLTVRHRFYAADSSYVDAVTVGRGADASDKSANKAMTASLKYALIEVFSVPTQDIDEGDERSPGTDEQDVHAQGVTGDAITDDTQKAVWRAVGKAATASGEKKGKVLGDAMRAVGIDTFVSGAKLEDLSETQGEAILATFAPGSPPESGDGPESETRDTTASRAAQIVADARKAAITPAQITMRVRKASAERTSDPTSLTDDELGKLEVLLGELRES